MSKSLSELTTILHRVDGSGYFTYQIFPSLERVREEDLEYRKAYPNPILVLQHADFSLELVNPIRDAPPDEATAIVISEGMRVGNKTINPAVYVGLKGR